MIIGLLCVLLLVLVLPFFVGVIERNLEIFLFIMGILSTVVSNVLNQNLVVEILTNRLLYLITIAVLIAGLIFKILKAKVRLGISIILRHVSLRLFVFFLIVILGLFSSIITAIISSLLLVEIVNALPLDRKNKINLDIIACFSIGLGAVLTPIGEPLATIVISKLNQDFWYLVRLLGPNILIGVIALGVFGSIFIKGIDDKISLNEEKYIEVNDENETYRNVIVRAGKIYLFIFALELLGAGFKPFIDMYVIKLSPGSLYFLNMISSILDNATLAAAEISSIMTDIQIKAVLMGLLISGGMLIPGNIPNIISANKLKIKSKEWARLGLPLGGIILIIYYIEIFII